MEAAVEAYRQVSRRSERDALIIAHLGLVRHVLGRTLANLPQRVDRENLESAGMLGLVEAATQFDESRGVSFASYAFPRIRGAILDELRRNCPLPQAMLQRWNRIREAYLHVAEEATPETLATASGLPVADVEECLEAVRLTQPETWYDELAEQIPDRSSASDVEPALQQEEQLRVLADLIEQLPKQMRIVFTLYYRDGLRLKEIGEALQLSESRISRILGRTELLLRERARRHN